MTSATSTSPRWASGLEHPEWLELREGHAPLVVVAPHGGRRSRPIRRGDSVNDLHTAGLAMELAERLDAHAIVNVALDRNEIDLNRIPHLVERAPFVLELLARAVDAARSAGKVPLVLFVHGWNMVLPCCDIGIGLRRRGGETSGRHPTLSSACYAASIAAIERELVARGLTAAIGRRYTASGRDNAAQLFSGRHAAHDDALVGRLARESVAGRVDAAQLELGIALRWPGRRREALLDGITSALSSSAQQDLPPRDASVPSARAWALPPGGQHESHVAMEQGYTLQAVLDGDARVAIFAGAEATAPHAMAARFSIVGADGTMMLLVGEGSWDAVAGRYALESLEWTARDEGREQRIRIHGPMIRYRTHEAYLDLESGLAASDLVEAEIDLHYEARDEQHGCLRGTVRAGDLVMEVDTTAFAGRGGRRPGDVREGLRLYAAKSGRAVVRRELLEFDESRGLGVVRGEGIDEAEVLARVPVWRPVGDGAFARWTFGILRCRFAGEAERWPGIFERLEVFRRAPRGG